MSDSLMYEEEGKPVAAVVCLINQSTDQQLQNMPTAPFIDDLIASMAIGFFLIVCPLMAFVGLLFAAFLIFTVYIYLVHCRYDHLPGPPYSFYLGHVHEMRKYHENGDFVGELFHQWHETYGPVLKFYVFHKCSVTVASPSIVKDILTKKKLFTKTPAVYSQLFQLYGVRFMGKGLLTETDHNAYHKRRVALNPALHKKSLRMFMSQFNSVGEKWVEKLTPLAKFQTTFNMHEHLCRVTLDAISEVAFNYKINAVETSSNIYLHHILNVLKGVAEIGRDPTHNWHPSRRQFRKDVAESAHFLRTLGGKLLQQRRAAIASGETVPQDVLTYIIREKDEVGDDLTDEDLLDDFISVFVAGQETTANALSFLLNEVVRRPEIALRLQEEVDTVLQGSDSITFDDLNKLGYVEQVFKESLRLYPPISLTTRMNLQEVIVDRFRIPKHTTLMINFYTIQRLSKHFEDADKFNPERFSADAERKPFTYLPFSTGTRSCIGQQFALIESKVLLSKFFQRFNVKFNPDQSVEIASEAVTLRPKGGTMMSISLRSRSTE